MKRLGPGALAARLALCAALMVVFTAACLTIPPRAAAGSLAFTALQESPQQSTPEQLNAKPAKTSREAAGEDNLEEYKHSWSVRKLAQYTGLGLEQAYQLSVILNFVGIGLLGVAFLKWGIPTLIPPIVPYMRQRTVLIGKAMEEARKASDDANRRLGEIEVRLSKLDTEIGQMRTAAEKESAEEEQKIKMAAEEDARKIVESAEQEIAAAAKSARRELTAYAADLAVTLAAKQIHVDTNTDQALVKDFTEQLSGNGGEGRKGSQ